jgi:hypothetical protein
MDCAELEFKQDWPEAARRLEAWWDGAVLDRAVVQVTAPRDGVTPRVVPAPPTLEERWTNVEYVLEAAQERMRTTYYGGDAFPCYCPNLGPDVFAGYLGCPIEFGEDTSWSVPIIADWASAPPLRLDPNNHWWKLTLEMTRAAMAVAPGRFLVGLTDLHGGMDAVAALRDPQNLGFDVVDHPEQVKQAVDELIPVWFEVYEGMRNLINPSSPGTTSWMSTWTAGRSYPVSCDFICMISPAMFREFVLKDLLAETSWLDRSIFHLDGPGALKHLDALLAIPRIRAIQWVPGEKIPRVPMTDWVPLLQKMQAAGKALHLSVTPEEVEPLMEALRPEGLLLSTRCGSEGEARNLVKLVERLTVQRR